MWKYQGKQRPDFALTPAAGEESVWDYPRPPRLQADKRRVVVKYGQQIIAQTRRSYRLLETASPPTFYLPADDVDITCLSLNNTSSFCEWKGQASYFDFVIQHQRISNAAWCYQEPNAEFSVIKNFISFYPSKLDCFVDEINVQPQAGDFYGGWITAEIIGPFKGDPGTQGW